MLQKLRYKLLMYLLQKTEPERRPKFQIYDLKEAMYEQETAVHRKYQSYVPGSE